jgi:Flp pilus assembly protein TadG
MAQSAPRLIERWAHLWRDRRGGVAVMTAVVLTGLLGAAGLGTEATLWYVAKRDMQSAADAAAFSAATAEGAGLNSTQWDEAADAVAKQYGYTNGSGGVTVTVNNPPQSGNYTTNGQAIEVIVSQTQTMLFSSLFLASAPTVTSRAVALPAISGVSGCVMALDKGSVTDVSDSGSSSLTLNNCSLLINSSASDALSMSGSVTISAYSASIVGNYSKSGTATITTTDGVTTGAAPVADPYASVPIPTYSTTTCNSNRLSVTGKTSVGASSSGGTYVFCNGVSLSGSSAQLTITEPGTYIINGGSLSLSGGATLCAAAACGGADGVTIVLTSSTGAAYGDVQESGSSTIEIVAPSTGTTAGMAIYQDRNASSSDSNAFSGSSSQSITGALYFPSAGVSYSGSSGGSGGSDCTQLIGYTLSFSGSTTFNANCTGTGVKGMAAASPTKLVE